MKFDLPLINAHTHAAMVGLRGLGEDEALDVWLNNYIWPAEEKIDSEFVFTNTELAIQEMKQNKIAAFCDMYFFEDEVAKASIKYKMPVILGIGMTDIDEVPFEKKLEKTEKLILRFKDHPFIRVSVAPHAIYTVSSENLKLAKELARKHKVVFQIHLSETKKEFDESIEKYGKTPTQYVDDLRLLDEFTLLAHCVWLTDDDIEIIARSKASVAHCPLSNLKLGSGIAPVAKMYKAGINICIGTDGAASSNRLDVWEAGKFAALLQKGINCDASIIKSQDIVKMMTINGIKALHLEDMAEFDPKTVAEKIVNFEHFDSLYHKNIEDF